MFPVCTIYPISNKYPIYPLYPIYWRATIKKIVFPRMKSNCRWSLLFTTTSRGVGVFLNCFLPLQPQIKHTGLHMITYNNELPNILKKTQNYIPKSTTTTKTCVHTTTYRTLSSTLWYTEKCTNDYNKYCI